jgi:hypothetical protein
MVERKCFWKTATSTRSAAQALYSTTTAFPEFTAGRLPHPTFQGLLGVHLRSGLPARRTAQGPVHRGASVDSLHPPPLRMLPAGATFAGRELHPLKINAFRCARKMSLGHNSLYEVCLTVFYVVPDYLGMPKRPVRAIIAASVSLINQKSWTRPTNMSGCPPTANPTLSINDIHALFTIAECKQS